MHGETIWPVLLVQIIVIAFLVSIIIFIARLAEAIKCEKRIAQFGITNIKDDEKSYFDKLYDLIWIVIDKIGVILKKSTVLSDYSKKYEKHISYDDRNIKSPIDYITIKFLLAFVFVSLNIVTIMFRYTTPNIFSLIITFIIGFFIPDIILSIEYSKKKKQISDDLLKAVIIMNNAFKSGRSIMQAIEIVRDELDGPIADEFKKIYLDLSYGLSIDVVFNRFYERIKLEDAKYITASLTLLNKTGGNIVKVFSMIEKSFFDKKKLQNELNSLTASSIFMFRLLVSLPFGLILLLVILNPTYFTPLFTTTIGRIALLFIITIYITYIYVVRKVIKVKM